MNFKKPNQLSDHLQQRVSGYIDSILELENNAFVEILNHQK